MIMIYFSGSVSSLVSVTVSDVARLFEVFTLLTPFLAPKSNGRLQCRLEVQARMQIHSPAGSSLWTMPSGHLSVTFHIWHHCPRVIDSFSRGMPKLWPWAETWKIWFLLWRNRSPRRVLSTSKWKLWKEQQLAFFALVTCVHIDSLAYDLQPSLMWSKGSRQGQPWASVPWPQPQLLQGTERLWASGYVLVCLRLHSRRARLHTQLRTATAKHPVQRSAW